MYKQEKYTLLLEQIAALIEAEDDLIANMANVSALIRETFGWHWVGFYLVKDDQLVLGPFQGPVACTRIAFGKGVCGSAWKANHTLLVDDVEQFPGHIACSAESRSEVVVPVRAAEKVIAVLDIDSAHLADFDQVDKKNLEAVVDLLMERTHATATN